MRVISKERAQERIAELSRRGHDLVTFWQECTEVLQAAVPHDDAPCWYTVDPASLLITSHYHEGLPELPPEMLQHQYYDHDVNQIADVVRTGAGISTLHEATDGNPASSPRWHMNMVMGGDQEMIAALRTGTREVWGAVGIYRAPGEPLFDGEDKALLRAVAPHLATGARTGLLVGEARDPQWPDSPGLVVLTESGEVESTTPGVERWLSDLPDGDWDAGRLPTAVHAVAGRALRTADGSDDPGEVAIARVLARSGTWVVLHGTSLVASGSRRAAVIVEPAHPARITPLLMSAYGLTEREREVTRRILRGDSTADIAQRLVVSPHTVQEHLKKIFEKTGVRSRRELVGKVFFAHYEPRFRDNEGRALDGDPLRGEPFPQQPEGRC
ncbi:MAG TPA: LuxR C-terminal-related transcriptional regulator [Solirubrobacteraceae bacterium]|nr:LuxR C-terminal-related transcriptional regulator [Solirubrobacteraceae bacterium]